MYGFHPEEPLAEEIGKNLGGYKPDKVESIRFRPSCIPDNLHYLPEMDAIRITLEGHKEQRQFVKDHYKARFILDMHETPIVINQEEMAYPQPHYQLNCPSWNRKLVKKLKVFAEDYEEPVWVRGSVPRGYPGYHAAAIEYYSKIKTKEGLKTLSEKQGTKFAKDVVDYLFAHYLA